LRLLHVLTLAIVLAGLWTLAQRARFRPSVVLITVDTLRPDRLGSYGHPNNHTPAIDRLAREGTLFETAYCDMPWTTGSMSSVMTGTYSPTHGVQLPIHRLGPEATTLAEILAAHGYQTGAVIGSFPLDSVYGLDRGFQTYDDEFTLPIFAVPDKRVEHVESQLPEDAREQAAFVESKLKNDAYRPDDEVTDAALRWFEKVRNRRRFFLWVHYFGPHEKLIAAGGIPQQEPRIIADYDPDVEINDRAVGRLLDRMRSLGLLDRSLVILHADHGQSLGEHDYVGHGVDIYDVSVRIPLIIRYPRAFPPHARRTDMAANVDLLPTILRVTGIDVPGRWVGRSLLAADHPTNGGEAPSAYFETYVSTFVSLVTQVDSLGNVLAPVAMRGMRTAEWKFIGRRVVGPCSRGEEYNRDGFGRFHLVDPVAMDEAKCREIKRTELYAVGDPEELPFNLAANETEVAARLEAIVAAVAESGRSLQHEFALTPEQERKLRSLGYLQ